MIELIDSIEAPETTQHPIPDAILHAQAIGAYKYGNSWPTYFPYSKARPDLDAAGRIVTITLTWDGPARCYDIESGGGKNENIGRFMEQADRTHGIPWLYTFASNMEAMLSAAEGFGYHRGRDFYAWAAHPNSRYGKHVCSPGVCGYPAVDATQFDFTVPGNCDASVCGDYMFPSATHPDIPEDAVSIAIGQNADGRAIIAVQLATGEVKHIEQDKANKDWWKDKDGHWNWLSLGNPGAAFPKNP